MLIANHVQPPDFTNIQFLKITLDPLVFFSNCSCKANEMFDTYEMWNTWYFSPDIKAPQLLGQTTELSRQARTSH